MSILDTFFLLFEADASKLEKGLADARKKGQETADQMRAVDVAAHKMGESIGRSIRELGGALIAAVAFKSMTDAMMAATEHADKLDETAQKLGINIEALSAWGDLTKKNGGSMEGFAGAIESFNRQLVQMEATGKSRAAPFLKELGIDLEAAANKGKTALDFLPQLADAFEGMDGQKAQALGSRLGLDAATIMTLQAGRREVEALLAKERELGVVTKEQGEVAGKFGDALDDMRHAWRSVWTEVATKVLPVFTWVAEKFQNVALFMRKHSDFIVGLMIALGAAIAFYVVPPLLSAGAAAIVAFAPFLLLGAIIGGLAVGFALLYDDVMNFLDGNDSLIGQIVEKWPVVADIAKAIVGSLRFLWDVAAALLEFLVTMFAGPGEAWDKFVANIVDGVERLLQLFPSLGDAAKAVGDAFAWAAKLAGGVAGVVAKAKGMLGLGGADAGVAQGVQAGRVALGATSSPIASVSSAAITNTTRGGDRKVSIGEVKVQTQATDAAGISKSIGGALGAQMRQANSQFDDGVAA